jgi:hypothetical protein
VGCEGFEVEGIIFKITLVLYSKNIISIIMWYVRGTSLRLSTIALATAEEDC